MKLFKDDEGALSVAKIIGVVILVIIGLLLLPIVTGAVYDAQQDENVTDTGSTLLGMVPLFYILGIVISAVIWVVAETRGIGGK